MAAPRFGIFLFADPNLPKTGFANNIKIRDTLIGPRLLFKRDRAERLVQPIIDNGGSYF